MLFAFPSRSMTLNLPAAACLLLYLLCQPASAVDQLIELEVTVDEDAGQTHFSWNRRDASDTAMEISRRVEGQTSALTWNLQATVPRTTTTWSDLNVSSGVIYEYKFYVPANDPTAVYASCGFQVPWIEDRGNVLLVVDETLALPLASELQRYEMDLTGDGWSVLRLNSSRHGTGTPESLRAAIQSIHSATPLSSIILFGKLPIVMSGSIRPDQHEPYRQATDLFYADIDGVWTDTLSDQENFYPGDGHYDQSRIPGPNHQVEVPLGRIDLSSMPAWPLSEVELLRRYLDKNHNFRHLRYEIPREAYFTSFPYDQTPIEAASAIAMVDIANCTITYNDDQTEQSRPFLWGFDARDWNGANYPNYRFKSQFTINFASGKQAWQWDNNEMRAMLALPWYGLTCFWGVRPNWFFHHTGMGKTLGYSNMRTVNNNDNNDPSLGLDYEPVSENYHDDPEEPGDPSQPAFPEGLDGYVHINMMGDPTLRIHPVAPARDLTAHADTTGVDLTWQPASDSSVSGYHLYTASNATGPYFRISDTPATTLSFRHQEAPTTTTYYMIRSLKLETSPVGSYWNAGQGIFTKVTPTQANTSPHANNRQIFVAPDSSANITVSASDPDGDSLTLSIATNASNGEVTGAAPNFIYTPAPGFVGTDSFQFNAWDGLAEAVGTITINVSGASPPLTYSQWTNTISWQGADSSPSGDPDHDELVNLLEYHLARNPTADDGGLFSLRDTQEQAEGTFYVFEFDRRKFLQALQLEISLGDLSSWTTYQPDNVTYFEEVIKDNAETETVRIKIRMDDNTSRFFLRFAVLAD